MQRKATITLTKKEAYKLIVKGIIQTIDLGAPFTEEDITVAENATQVFVHINIS